MPQIENLKPSNNLIPYYLKNLRGIDLSHTDLRGADLEQANLEGSILRAADLERAVNLPISMDEAKARGAYT